MTGIGLGAWFREYLSCDYGCIGWLEKILGGMFRCGSANMQSVAAHVESGAQEMSVYRGIQKFFGRFAFRDDEYVKLQCDYLSGLSKKLYFALDRTDWYYGAHHNNLLILSILYEGHGIPVLVRVLDKSGNSSTDERLEMIDSLVHILGIDRIGGVFGDREFVGDGWFKGLKERQVPFVMRGKCNTVLGTPGGECMEAEALVRKEGEIKLKDVHVGTQMIAFSGKMLPAEKGVREKEEMLGVFSWGFEDPLEAYRLRWGIEVGFKCLKTKGFDLECTKFVHPARLKTLVQLCALAVAHAVKEAVRHIAENPMKMKLCSKKKWNIRELHSFYLENA